MPASHDIAILKDRFLKKSILAIEAFGFRGDKYITKKVRNASYRRHAYWILSMPLLNYY